MQVTNQHSHKTLLLASMIFLLILIACAPPKKDICPALEDIETNLLQSINNQHQAVAEWLNSNGMFMNALGQVTAFPTANFMQSMLDMNNGRVQTNINRLNNAKQNAPPNIRNALDQLQKSYERLKKHYQEIQNCINGEQGHDPKNPCLSPEDYKKALEKLQQQLDAVKDQNPDAASEAFNKINQALNALNKPVDNSASTDILDRLSKVRAMHQQLQNVRDATAIGTARPVIPDELARPGLDNIGWLGDAWSFGIPAGDPRWNAFEDLWTADNTLTQLEHLLEKAYRCKTQPAPATPPPCDEQALTQKLEDARRQAWHALQSKSFVASQQDALNNNNPLLDPVRQSVHNFQETTRQVLRGEAAENFNAANNALAEQLLKASKEGAITNAQAASLAMELDILTQAIKDMFAAEKKLQECQERNARGR